MSGCAYASATHLFLLAKDLLERALLRHALVRQAAILHVQLLLAGARVVLDAVELRVGVRVCEYGGGVVGGGLDKRRG